MNQDSRDRLEGKRMRLERELNQVNEELSAENETADGLTPELHEIALNLRQGMNERLVTPDGRLLLLPPDTGFKGTRLYGFEVRVIDKPIALCGEDFPQSQTFVIRRTDELKRLDPKTLICLSPAVSIEDSLTGADWNDLVERVEHLEIQERQRRRNAA